MSPLEEIEKKNDSNLNVTLYVMQDEENEGINIAQEYAELKELERQRQEVTNKLEQYIAEIAQATEGKKGVLQGN